jgi:hypothetical protein
MTKIFLDCEFNEFEGDLFSIALVGDDGAEWYRISEFGRDEMIIGPWVKANVLPYLRSAVETTTVSHSVWADLADDMARYLANYDNPEIIADWPADFEHFANLLSTIGARGGFNDAYACTMKLINTPALKPEIPHNALSDARALRDWYMRDQLRRAILAFGYSEKVADDLLALNSETGTQNDTSAKSEDA